MKNNYSIPLSNIDCPRSFRCISDIYEINQPIKNLAVPHNGQQKSSPSLQPLRMQNLTHLLQNTKLTRLPFLSLAFNISVVIIMYCYRHQEESKYQIYAIFNLIVLSSFINIYHIYIIDLDSWGLSSQWLQGSTTNERFQVLFTIVIRRLGVCVISVDLASDQCHM